MPTIPSFRTTCTAKRVIAPGVYELRFTKPEGFVYRAGQFVMFDVPYPDNAADVQVRAYSVASIPGEEDLLFVIKLVKNGRASAWVEHTLSVGGAVTMRGPLGALAFESGEKPIVCIATGTGVAPFRSLILSALLAGEKRRIDLLFGVRGESDLFWKEEWQSFEAQYQNLHVRASFLDGTANWHGEKGILQDMAYTRLNEGPASVYLCGAPDIVKSLQESCLHEWNVAKDDVHVESFV